MQKVNYLVFTIALVMLLGCVENNPAGTAAYTNPEYPSQIKGFFYCGSNPIAVAFAPDTSVVWISEPDNNFLWYKDVSKAVVNPVICDTLNLDFSPGIIEAPPSGDNIFVHHHNTAQVFTVDTSNLRWMLSYTATSTMQSMKLSSDGSFMYLGSQGVPWHIESVSTDNWELINSFEMEWPVNRLAVSPDGSTIAVANSTRKEVLLFSGPDLTPLRALELPMRVGTIAFSENSEELIILDAASLRPYMLKIDVSTGEELYSSRPINSYLSCFAIQGTNTLLLPRNQDEGVSVLNMGNMIFAPSIPADSKIGSVCASNDREYIVTISRTTIPGTATVYIN